MFRSRNFSCFSIFVVFLIFSFFSSFAFGAFVDLKAEVFEEKTRFNMLISFSPEESYKTFSFERPLGSEVLSALDVSSNRVLRVSSAGNFFIFKPDSSTANKTYLIVYDSSLLSRDIFEKYSMSFFVNSNVPIDRMVFSLNFTGQFPKVSGVYPRNFISSGNNSYLWYFDSLQEDSLFLVQFSNTAVSDSLDDEKGFFIFDSVLFWLVLVFFIVLISGLYFIILRKKKTEKKEELVSEIKEELVEGVLESNPAVSKSMPEIVVSVDSSTGAEVGVTAESFEEFISKYLTANEREVVLIVSKNEGISQFDILNFLPQLSKSNLSKIITKLHGRKFLNRVRVGKVNKIFLGERLSVFKKN